MIDLKAFRKANGLKQQDVASLLGVTRAYVCQMELGYVSIPDNHLNKLREQEGLDTTMLWEQGPDNSELLREIEKLKAQVATLNARIDQLQRDKSDYWALIKKLTK